MEVFVNSLKQRQVFLLQLVKPGNSLKVQAAYQLSTKDSLEPDEDWKAVGTGLTGVSTPDLETIDVDLTTSDPAVTGKWFIRFGVVASRTSGTALAYGDVTLRVGATN